MTVEIDEKQMPDDTADDFEFKASISDKEQLYDEYALKCETCDKNMILLHSIHTIALLFQDYKCKCPCTDRHIIVRDKGMNESVVHQSKGIENISIAKQQIEVAIALASDKYYTIKQLAHEVKIDARLELVVHKAKNKKYQVKLSDADYVAYRLQKIGALLRKIEDTLKCVYRGDVKAVKHVVRYIESFFSNLAFQEWLYRLTYNTCVSMIESTISYMADVYVHQVSDSAKSNYKSLYAMISCMAAIVDDLCSRAFDEKYEIPDDVINESIQIAHILADHSKLRYAQFKQIIQNYVDKHLLKMGAIDHSLSMPLSTYVSPIDRFTFTPNLNMSYSRKLMLSNIMQLMAHRLQHCVFIVSNARHVEVCNQYKNKIRKYSEMM